MEVRFHTDTRLFHVERPLRHMEARSIRTAEPFFQAEKVRGHVEKGSFHLAASTIRSAWALFRVDRPLRRPEQ
jgi:hypothetical protein